MEEGYETPERLRPKLSREESVAKSIQVRANGATATSKTKKSTYNQKQPNSMKRTRERTRERMFNAGQQATQVGREAVEKAALVREAAQARRRDVAENSIVRHMAHALRILFSFPFFFIVGSFPYIAWLKQEQYHALLLFLPATHCSLKCKHQL